MSSPFRRKRSTIGLRTSFIRRMSLYLMIGFMFIFIVTTLGSAAHSKLNLSSLTLKKWTNHISIETLISTLSMEIPALQTYNKSAGIETTKVSNMLLEMAISFNPEDPRSLIRNELPGFSFFDGQVVVAGQGVSYTDFPMESSAPMEIVLAEREATLNKIEQEKAPATGSSSKPSLSTDGRKVVFIYHTHNRESWLPHLPEKVSADEAYHEEVNITLIGKRLGEELEKRGIGTHVDTTDITKLLHEVNKPYAFSYEKSREVVKEVLSQQKDVTFMFDIHRDSLPRDRTTVEINGKEYARSYFVIGGQNRNYEKNQKFAEQLHAMLEKAYPGLSKGVFLKAGGNGEYNQSLSENNLLIEIGGVENTVEESYRTAEALAEVIADLYWDAEKVNANTDSKDF